MSAKYVDGVEKSGHNLASLLLKNEIDFAAEGRAKKSCKKKGLSGKAKRKKLDAKRKTLHNLVSLLLTNKTIRGVAQKEVSALAGRFFKN